MDQARSTISKIFNGEPHSYTRFNMTQNMEGDNSQVEMKLSSDGDEEVGGNGVGDHLNHNSNRKPYAAQKIGRTPKNLCFMGATIFLIFIIGYLIGYLVHRKKDSVPVSAASMSSLEENVVHETGAAPLMDWNYVKTLLADKLKVNNFETTLSAYESANHRAGSSGDESLGNRVLATFKECGMITWAEEHFIKVQDPPAPGKPNRVVFKDKTYTPEGFLSYSATGTKTGAVVYAHYGRDIDIALLRKNNIDLKDRVVLVKSGLINFAEKVANAAKQKAAAVLIYPDSDNIASLFGHVHMGSGDPYTPGFPSFNHTQFPPIQSSGLPTILAQTISKTNAIEILGQLNGQMLPSAWGSSGKVGDFGDNITVEVNNVLTDKPIHNVFGVIKGFVDADRYMIVGAQRDAWGPGYAASTVGTSVLIELARAISDMVKNDGFKPRRSIIFASWSAGEYGSIGATEWLEGYLSSLSMKAFSYINLDGIVTGSTEFKVAASPLMHSLVGSTIKEVGSMNKGATILTKIGNWESDVLEPLKMDNAAYPFLSFSGIPAVAFRFTSKNSEYPYFGTMQDTRVKLRDMTNDKVSQLAQLGAQFAGHIVLRLVHDHLLQMDLAKYDKIIRTKVAQINLGVLTLRRSNPDILPKDLTMQWLISASGSFSRASRQMAKDILNSNLEDIEMCRTINDRLMTVERNLLSPYVSPRENPFRHIIIGFGPNTIQGLLDNLEALRTKKPEADVDLFRNQFALATWTVQGCANSLAGNVWSLDNEI